MKRLALFLLLLAAASVAETPPAEPGRLYELRWVVSAPIGGASGEALLIHFHRDLWRLEAGADPASDPRTRLGDGWTLSAPGDSTLYIQPWGGDLEPLAPADAAKVRALVRALISDLEPGTSDLAGLTVLRATASAPPRRFPWDDPAGPQESGWRLRWETGAGNCRDRLERRGLGRGDGGETWTLIRVGEGWRASAASRHGTLHVRIAGQRRVEADPFEATLPVWPLAEIELRIPKIRE